VKTLKCHCGRVRVGVPRRQKTCSVACARSLVLAALAKSRAARTARARRRVLELTPAEAWKDGYQAGWQKGYRRAMQQCGERVSRTGAA